ncbi:hypothetical protein CDL15_Pgr002706 [Punica granatum]|uniref:Uncharacterized protein n=1 Tax=Punica granatum TaxID=22663 RepID=A0A218Y0H7_PUNGR|nr:hypothetical protein CDL15_Pgr002706 [Punica granatum]
MHPKQLYFSAQGSVPFGYDPTTFLLRGPSLSGTSRLLFYSGIRPLQVSPDYFSAQGVRPLRVRPDYFSAQGSVPFGYVPTTFLLRGPSPTGTSRLLFPAPCNPPGKMPRTLQTRRATCPAPRKSIG